MIKITKETLCVEAETLKDILWYIQGVIDQSRLEISDCSFNSYHIEALQVAINVLNEKVKRGEVNENNEKTIRDIYKRVN